MEIKKASFFNNYGAVNYCGDDTITVLNYSAGLERPSMVVEKSNYYSNNNTDYITIKSVAPPLRELVTFFLVTRTSANVYKYFFWHMNLVESGMKTSLKDIEEYLIDKFSKLKIAKICK